MFKLVRLSYVRIHIIKAIDSDCDFEFYFKFKPELLTTVLDFLKTVKAVVSDYDFN